VAKLRILVLDDEPIVGKRLKPALAKAGYEVDVVDRGDDAIRLIDQHEYDIIVSDIRMEGADGLDVLRRATVRSARTKVIMITGYATVEVAREALTMGAFDFIAKPFKLEDLRSAIARAVAKLAEEDGRAATA
jgi:DNA-binding NtrC family response regulator